MSKTPVEVTYALDSLKMERYIVELFSNLTERVKDEEMAQTLHHFVEEEKGHCSFWERFLADREVEAGHVQPSIIKLKIYTLLARVFGFGLVYKLMERSEREAIKRFSEMLAFDDI